MKKKSIWKFCLYFCEYVNGIFWTIHISRFYLLRSLCAKDYRNPFSRRVLHVYYLSWNDRSIWISQRTSICRLSLFRSWNDNTCVPLLYLPSSLFKLPGERKFRHATFRKHKILTDNRSRVKSIPTLLLFVLLSIFTIPFSSTSSFKLEPFFH